jgi:hypothetical protein
MDMTRRLLLVLAVLGVLASIAPAAGVATATPATSAPVVHLSHPDGVAAGAKASSSGALYRFQSLLAGKPIRWNPCTPIHWRFRAPGAPAGALPMVKKAVARVAKATGTTWVYDGAMWSAPTTAWLPTSTKNIRPVLIGWTDAAHSDLLKGQPKGVLGVTRTAWFSTTRDGKQLAAIRAAVIALDQTDRLPLTGSVSWYGVTLHELAHAMGLDHAANSRQLLYPILQRGLTDLQSGDLQGLAKVGRQAGCVTVP